MIRLTIPEACYLYRLAIDSAEPADNDVDYVASVVNTILNQSLREATKFLTSEGWYPADECAKNLQATYQEFCGRGFRGIPDEELNQLAQTVSGTPLRLLHEIYRLRVQILELEEKNEKLDSLLDWDWAG